VAFGKSLAFCKLLAFGKEGGSGGGLATLVGASSGAASSSSQTVRATAPSYHDYRRRQPRRRAYARSRSTAWLILGAAQVKMSHDRWRALAAARARRVRRGARRVAAVVAGA